MKLLASLATSLVLSATASAQYGYPIVFEEVFDGPETTVLTDVIQTMDGGFVSVGSRISATNPDLFQAFVVKLDAGGSPLWTYQMASPGWSSARSIVETSSGELLVVGSDDSGSSAILLIQLSAGGQLQWTTNLGTADHSAICGVLQTPDGGFVMAGTLLQAASDDHDFFLMKASASGAEQWSKSYDLADRDLCWDLAATADGGFVLTGMSELPGYVPQACVVRVNANGAQLWSRHYAGPGNGVSESHAITETLDGGFALAGRVNFAPVSPGAYNKQGLLMKLDAQGIVLWDQTYGADADKAKSGLKDIVETGDGGLVVTGYEDIVPSDLAMLPVRRIDQQGQEKWVQIFGTPSMTNTGRVIRLTSDGGLILLGQGPPDGPAGKSFLMRLGPMGLEASSDNLSIQGDQVDLTLSGGLANAGRTYLVLGGCCCCNEIDDDGNSIDDDRSWQRRP